MNGTDDRSIPPAHTFAGVAGQGIFLSQSEARGGGYVQISNFRGWGMSYTPVMGPIQQQRRWNDRRQSSVRRRRLPAASGDRWGRGGGASGGGRRWAGPFKSQGRPTLHPPRGGGVGLAQQLAASLKPTSSLVSDPRAPLPPIDRDSKREFEKRFVERGVESFRPQGAPRRALAAGGVLQLVAGEGDGVRRRQRDVEAGHGEGAPAGG